MELLRKLQRWFSSMLLRSRLLRSLVSFVDLCLLEVLWWIYACPLFLFSIGRSLFIYHPEAENTVCLGYVDSLVLFRLNKSMNSPFKTSTKYNGF